MRRGIAFALSAVLLVLLLLSVFGQVWVLPSAAERVVATFPETRPFMASSIIWGVVAIACWQAVAIIGLWLVMLARQHRFGPAAYGWLWAMVGCLLAFMVIAVSAFVALRAIGYATPAMLGLIGGGLLALIAAGSLVLFLVTRR